MKANKSKKLFKEARQIMVGGVNSPVRSFNGVGGDPLILDRGKGAHIYDIDGCAYTDYCLSWGALILGHKNKRVFNAINDQLKKGSSFGATTKPEIALAKFITNHVPSIEKIRFVNSGTEASMSALRLARGYTGRKLVLKFDGHYHGHVDDLLTTAGSGVAKLKQSSSAGIPKQHINNTISLPYNDIDALTATIEQHQDKIACVAMEPVTGNMGVIVPKKSFLQTARKLTRKYGIVLLFDEVMTGFRGQLGSVQADMDIKPDITCFGKIIGGGFPIGAYGGSAEIMDHLAPLGPVYQAGTFSGNPVVMRAGLATLKQLTTKKYAVLNERCEEFAQDLNLFFRQIEAPVHLAHYKSMMSLRFRKESVLNYQDAQKASSATIYANLFLYLLRNGIYFPPADLEAFFVSTAHTQKDLNHLSTCIKTFFSDHLNEGIRL